ncbi:MAG: hypothetical protein A3F67_00700 [Verrucomicrobia bacterium RIFCSPHIGHO2_12_FULL_41_10]|nr:MAG: hypothetical protein A3F67_00700 [Verrucomicrobia bacterium RIFCSPHIGHO2_12_FULL_41_10]HLB33876.1 hypothetical protein [Chthoniobacterales bacterium]
MKTKSSSLLFLLGFLSCSGLLLAQNVSSTHAASISIVSQQEKKGIAISSISREEYCDFLNAVASSSDRHQLWHEEYGIDRTEGEGRFFYSLEQLNNHFIVPPSYLDVARYCNWREHGSLQGKEGFESIEAGTYQIQNEEIVSVNPEARYFLDEVFFNFPRLQMDPLIAQEEEKVAFSVLNNLFDKKSTGLPKESFTEEKRIVSNESAITHTTASTSSFLSPPNSVQASPESSNASRESSGEKIDLQLIERDPAITKAMQLWAEAAKRGKVQERDDFLAKEVAPIVSKQPLPPITPEIRATLARINEPLNQALQSDREAGRDYLTSRDRALALQEQARQYRNNAEQQMHIYSQPTYGQVAVPQAGGGYSYQLGVIGGIQYKQETTASQNSKRLAQQAQAEYDAVSATLPFKMKKYGETSNVITPAAGQAVRAAEEQGIFDYYLAEKQKLFETAQRNAPPRYSSVALKDDGLSDVTIAEDILEIAKRIEAIKQEIPHWNNLPWKERQSHINDCIRYVIKIFARREQMINELFDLSFKAQCDYLDSSKSPAPLTITSLGKLKASQEAFKALMPLELANQREYEAAVKKIMMEESQKNIPGAKASWSEIITVAKRVEWLAYRDVWNHPLFAAYEKIKDRDFITMSRFHLLDNNEQAWADFDEFGAAGRRDFYRYLFTHQRCQFIIEATQAAWEETWDQK